VYNFLTKSKKYPRKAPQIGNIVLKFLPKITVIPFFGALQSALKGLKP